jgi:U3 small nucleolar RNA-associated protein 11
MIFYFNNVTLLYTLDSFIKHYKYVEKHKDYVVRAKDYHNKQKYIKNLKNKIVNKDPDEFYFNMKNSKMVNGKHRDLNNERSRVLDAATVKLLKTQDLGNSLSHMIPKLDRS